VPVHSSHLLLKGLYRYENGVHIHSLGTNITKQSSFEPIIMRLNGLFQVRNRTNDHLKMNDVNRASCGPRAANEATRDEEEEGP
jgi:hypothetical protein